MNAGESQDKIFVVDSNLFFVKRLAEALRQQGFDVVHCSEPAYALTMIEWNMPAAILCASHFSNSTGFEIPSILRADPKTRHIPVIAMGDRGQQSQLESLRAGYADFIDRRLGAEEITAHLVSLISSHRDGFHPTQMLARSETALDGRLSLVDLPGVIQVLAQSRQTGGLHINADTADGIIFFDAGEIIHAECGQYAGDDAIIHLVKSCYLTKDGEYKFIPGDPVTLRTVQGSLNALILDALRQLDEKGRDAPAVTEAHPDALEAPVQEAVPQGECKAVLIESDQVTDLPAEEEDVREVGAGILAETLTEIETDSLPEMEGVPELLAEPDETIESTPELATEAEITETENNHSCEIPEYEDKPREGNNNPLSLEQSFCESIIDQDALRDLDELLKDLKVEEHESHE